MRRKRHKNRRRAIPAGVARRAASMDVEMLFLTLDNVLMALGGLIDQYHYHDAPFDEIQKGIDLLFALWDEVEKRDV